MVAMSFGLALTEPSGISIHAKMAAAPFAVTPITSGVEGMAEVDVVHGTTRLTLFGPTCDPCCHWAPSVGRTKQWVLTRRGVRRSVPRGWSSASGRRLRRRTNADRPF